MAEERDYNIYRGERPERRPRRPQNWVSDGEGQRQIQIEGERQFPRQPRGQLPPRQQRAVWRPLRQKAQFNKMRGDRGQKFIDLLQSLRLRADQFPIHSKSDYFTNKLLAALNLQNSSEETFENELLTILDGLNFDTVVSEGPICRQKKTSLRYYRCFDCESNGTFACFCEECFQEEIHKDHTFKLYPKPFHCDCGDLAVLKRDSFCKKHRDFIPQNQITFAQQSLFYDCMQFLFFLSFELIKVPDPRNVSFNSALLYPLFHTIQLLTQNSYEYKKTVAKLFVSHLKECYQPFQKSILQQIFSTRQQKDLINRLLLGLYDVPSYRSSLVQKYWNYYTCYKYTSHAIKDYQTLAILLFSEVDTINRLLKEFKISGIDLKCLDKTQERIETFFMIHRIMKNHVGYAQFIELTQVDFQFQREYITFRHKENKIQSYYREYMINIIEALSKSENGRAVMRKMVRSSYQFIKRQRKTDLSQNQKYRTYYAEVCFSLTLFALYKFDLNLLQQQPLKKILSLLDEHSQQYLLVEQFYGLLLYVSEQITSLVALDYGDKIASKSLCYWYLLFKILLIIQSKLQKELKYDMLEFKFQAGIINNGMQDKPLNLYINTVYAIQVDLSEVIIANDMGHSQIQKMVQLLKMLKFINSQINKRQLYYRICNWIPNFQQLRMSGHTQLYHLTETEDSHYNNRISFTSPFIPAYNTVVFTRFFNLKKHSKVQRNELSSHFFSKYLEQKMESLFECVLQRLKAVTNLSFTVIEYVNKWLNLSTLLYLETKRQTYRSIALALIQKVPEFIFREQNKFHIHSKIIKANIIQPLEAVIPEPKKLQSPKAQSKAANDKKLKMMNKIKQMQQNYMKKIDVEVDKQEQKKEEEHICLICKMPDNLVILCNANKNTFLYSSLYGYQRPFLMITTCGHFVHQKCISPRNRRMVNRNYRDNSQLQLVCELCKQQANLALPFVSSYDLSLEKFNSQLEYLHQDIKCILYPGGQNKQKNKKKQNEIQNCLKEQSQELDQVLFQSLLFSIYFFFTSHSKFFTQKILKAIKNVIAFMQIKLKIKGLNIRPLNLHMKDISFKHLEQILALLICSKESMRYKLIFQIQQKIEELQPNEEELKTNELLKLVLWLTGKEKHKISSKFVLEKFNLFNLPKDLVDLNKISNRCQSCKTLSSSKLPNLTNQTRICLMCGLISCYKCRLTSKKFHVNQLFNYDLSCESGILNGFPLYTDEFGFGPQECNKYALTARNLYTLNQNNYQKVLNCILSSKEFKNIRNENQDRWQEDQWNIISQPLVVMPRDVMQFSGNLINFGRRETEEYDWMRGGQQGPRAQRGLRRGQRDRFVVRRVLNARGRFRM